MKTAQSSCTPHPPSLAGSLDRGAYEENEIQQAALIWGDGFATSVVGILVRLVFHEIRGVAGVSYQYL